jgi:hypothetical protein
MSFKHEIKVNNIIFGFAHFLELTLVNFFSCYFMKKFTIFCFNFAWV